VTDTDAAYRTWLTYRGVWGFVGTLSWTTAAVYFVRDVGMSPLQLVLAGTALELAYFLFEVPTGIVADLYSRKLSIIVGAVISGLAMVAVGALPQVGFVIAAMAVWGFGWTFRSGAEDAWLADEIGNDRLGSAYQRGAQVARVTGLVGIAVAVALALVDLRLPFVVAGGTTVLLAAYLAIVMSEAGFTRPERRAEMHPVRAVGATARQGAGLVRSSPILLLILGIFFFLGAFEEGFDRLWEAHLLLEVGLPEIGPLGDVAWFGILGAATLILSFAVAAPLVERVEQLRAERLARLLLVLHAVLLACALGFALAGSLLLAAVAYLATSVVRDLTGPPFQTWLNGTITDSTVRATVLSFTSISGSLGEWTGGPALGAIGTRLGVRSALATGALLLAPTLVLFGRAIRHHGLEPELAAADAADIRRRTTQP
jgi:MFS transporter, DHA3 family, tetracycline resistance protein